ncbi:hypothetical protein [Sphingobacterium luzhongxinii]|uniref:hypothetical protein n=1 Tax=Sphingobacterium luzhongxinii TaxID=2654181 RepID=UPI0013DAD53A|nr:hypothetical protein [Sphingobacterium sp. xlx-73]
MKLERAIDVFRIKDKSHIGSYVLDLDAQGILQVLDDLVLNEDDFADEIYDPYTLTENQVKKLSPFLKEHLVIDFTQNLYELMSYELKV